MKYVEFLHYLAITGSFVECLPHRLYSTGKEPACCANSLSCVTFCWKYKAMCRVTSADAVRCSRGSMAHDSGSQHLAPAAHLGYSSLFEAL